MTDTTSRTRIHKLLRRSIIMGHCRPGQRLSVEDLAAQHGTSVTPVRDALQMLSQEGLVTIRPRSGYFVTRVTLKQLRDLFELRRILELAAVEQAVTRISDQELAELERIHAGYTGDDDVSYERYTDENRRFHGLIAEASGNHELAEAVRRLHDRLARFMVIRRAGRTMERAHARIVQALRARDPVAARAAMLEELDDTRERVIDHLIQEEGDLWQLGTPSDETGAG
jgi:DNA-binding GntR family transcriptional regulator